SPSTVAATDSVLLTVQTSAGTNPTSTGLAVTVDLSSIGGSATQTFYDDGTNGDVTASDGTFSFSTSAALGTSGGGKNLPATITDAQSRSGSANIALNVLAATNPSGTGAASPNSANIGDTSLLTVTVSGGANPTSTGITVSGDL